MSETKKNARDADIEKVTSFLASKDGKRIEKFFLRFALRLPVITMLLVIFGLVLGYTTLMEGLFVLIVAHLYSFCYFSIRRDLHNKKILRCDWII